MKIVMPYSGGLDSRIMDQWAKINYPDAEVVRVFFDIGQGYNAKEVEAIERSGLEVTTRMVDWLRGSTGVGKRGSLSGNIYIPGRNAALAMLAATMFYPVDEIWLGALAGETHDDAHDKNYTFINKFNDLVGYVMQAYGPKPRLRFPFAEAGLSKLGTVRWALANGLTQQDLLETSSCLTAGPYGHRCGKCVVCFRRWGIFQQCGFEESYEQHPPEQIEHIQMTANMLRSPERYDRYRAEEVIPAMAAYYGLDDHDRLLAKFDAIIESESHEHSSSRSGYSPR